MKKQHKVVITGLGIISPFGEGINRYWQNISQGQSAIQAWQPENCHDYPVKYAARVDFAALTEKYQAELAELPPLEQRSVMGWLAAKQAILHAGYTQGSRIGVAACSGVPEILDDEILKLATLGEYPKNLQQFIKELPQPSRGGIAVGNDSLATTIAQSLELNGPVMNTNGACAGAAQAIGLAYRAIARGEVDAMLAGGADSVANVRVMSALFLLGATATDSPKGDKICCPFDRARSGLVSGEGGAFLLLESEQSALTRGATIYAEVLGYGSSLDAYKVTAPHPEGAGAIAAMQKALADAELATTDIDYINAHGTSTPLNDVVESQAIRRIFGQKSPKVSSTKSMIGHWIAAAAAPEAIATILAIYHGVIPPTINLVQADEQCTLDYVANAAQEQSIRYALSNSFGFGGINASLAFGAY